MIEVKTPRVDAEQLLERVRTVVARRRRAVPGELIAPAPTAFSRLPGLLGELERLIKKGGEYWAVGSALPPMAKTRGVVRWVATPAARTVLRVGQLITRDQRTFNQTLLEALERTREALAELSQERGAMRAELQERMSELAQDAAQSAVRAARPELERASVVGLGELRAELGQLRAQLEARGSDAGPPPPRTAKRK